jgi:enoyl-CoA hydratase
VPRVGLLTIAGADHVRIFLAGPVSGSSSVLVRSETVDGIATLVLDDPGRRNALSWDMVQALQDAIDDAVASGCRALILRNTPPVFCAGGSVDDLLAPKAPLDDMYGAFRALDRAGVATVAVVEGAAVGAGINLLLACDVALCSPESRFDVRFLDVGIHPGGGQLWRLRRSLGAPAVAAMTLFGEVLTGEQAANLGLVWRCLPSSELGDEARRLARRAAAHDPELVSRVKTTLHAADALVNADAAIAFEREAQKWSMERPEFEAALRDLRVRLGRNGREGRA